MKKLLFPAFLILTFNAIGQTKNDTTKPKLIKIEMTQDGWQRGFQIIGEVYSRIGYSLPTVESDSLRQLCSQLYTFLTNQYAYQKQLSDSADVKKSQPANKPKK
jgi:hypothetical protein